MIFRYQFEYRNLQSINVATVYISQLSRERAFNFRFHSKYTEIDICETFNCVSLCLIEYAEKNQSIRPQITMIWHDCRSDWRGECDWVNKIERHRMSPNAIECLWITFQTFNFTTHQGFISNEKKIVHFKILIGFFCFCAIKNSNGFEGCFGFAHWTFIIHYLGFKFRWQRFDWLHKMPTLHNICNEIFSILSLFPMRFSLQKKKKLVFHSLVIPFGFIWLLIVVFPFNFTSSLFHVH